MNSFKLEIITPLGIKFEKEVEYILLKTTEGNMGILPNHAPFVAGLYSDEIKIRLNKSDEISYYISGGFLEINKEKVLIIVDEAMLPDEIDLLQAKKELEFAQKKLEKLNEDKQIVMAQKSLQDALVKVRVAERLL
ncbi:MAG: ATP synthase F1 subunit epsilon [Fusobacterium sp. JB021]|nr:ATP synthase F1 subunit epsilon [Fusobacterium sp. JB020]MDP0492924.1 ATP synthase F1 subunit epsilon [Fusobacterium sp. JB021]MDP0505614.1 ATP synthase F1 subunit epsilon [Fusobacterium sp. JB019]